MCHSVVWERNAIILGDKKGSVFVGCDLFKVTLILLGSHSGRLRKTCSDVFSRDQTFHYETNFWLSGTDVTVSETLESRFVLTLITGEEFIASSRYEILTDILKNLNKDNR